MWTREVPVLMIAFGRVEYARQTFEAIKAAKPKKFYFYTNKGRTDNPDECERNEIVRALSKEVDWDCELTTWFRDEPVDVYNSLKGAIDWVFEKEERAIILEEDCVASLAFFDFQEKMLNKYADNPKVWMIGGSNYIEQYNPHNNDYHFSRNIFIHGWGAWRDRWNSVDWKKLPIDDIINNNVLDATFNTPRQRRFHKNRLLKNRDFIDKTMCWDFVFYYNAAINNALGITPARHLVKNIGIDGVHTKKADKSIANNEITYVLEDYNIDKEPQFFVNDIMFDKKMFYELFYKRSTIFYRALHKVLRMMFIE